MGIFTFPGTLDTVVGDPAGVFAPDLAPYALLAGATFSGVARVPAGTAALPGLAVGAVTAGAWSGGATTTEYLALSSNGIEFLRGVGNAASTSLVTLTGSSSSLSLKLQNNTTNLTAQNYFAGLRHYTAAEEPVGLFWASGLEFSSTLYIGGGSSVFNAVTQVGVFAAANTTTVIGTEMHRTTTAGLRVQAGVSAAASYLLQVATTADALALCVSDSLGVIGAGVAPISGTKLAVVQASGTQLRLGYDSSNYASLSVGSTGTATLSLTGASTPYLLLTAAGAALSGVTTHIALRDSTAVALGVGASLAFQGTYTAGSQTGLASIKAYKATATDGEYGGHLDLYSRANGANLAANLRVGTEGRVLIRADITTQVADTRLHVYGAAATNLPVVTIEQADTDEPFENFVGSEAASSATSLSSWTTGGAINGFIRVAVNGTDRWIPTYTAPTA